MAKTNSIELTCIICPNGCDLAVEVVDGQVTKVDNALCPKGRDYAAEELTNPVRTLTSTVQVTGGELPLVSVRTNGPIPKSRLFEAMQVVRQVIVAAPVCAGQKLVEDFLDTGVSLVATRDVARR